MVTIHLNKLLFHSYHGVHEEEKLIGGGFEMNISIQYKETSLPIKHLNETINYATVYDIVKARMQQPTELLETIVTELASQIFEEFPIAEEVQISLTKLHPPIVAIQGSVGVSFNLKRNQ